MQYTLRLQHFFGLIQHRLGYILFFRNFQEVFKDSEILCAMSIDHSAPFCLFFNISTSLKKVQAYENLTNPYFQMKILYKSTENTSKKLK